MCRFLVFLVVLVFMGCSGDSNETPGAPDVVDPGDAPVDGDGADVGEDVAALTAPGQPCDDSDPCTSGDRLAAAGICAGGHRFEMHYWGFGPYGGNFGAQAVAPLANGYIIVGTTPYHVLNGYDGLGIVVGPGGQWVDTLTWPLEGESNTWDVASDGLGGAWIAGNETAGSYADGAVYRVDPSGTLLFSQTLGDLEDAEYLMRIVAHPEGGAIAGGYDEGQAQSVAWLVRLDEDGELLWSARLMDAVESWVREIDVWGTGDVLAVGTARDGGDHSVWAGAVDAAGEELWTITLADDAVTLRSVVALQGGAAVVETNEASTIPGGLLLRWITAAGEIQATSERPEGFETASLAVSGGQLALIGYSGATTWDGETWTEVDRATLPIDRFVRKRHEVRLDLDHTVILGSAVSGVDGVRFTKPPGAYDTAEDLESCGSDLCFGETCDVAAVPPCASSYCHGADGCALSEHPGGTWCAVDSVCSDAACVLSCSLDCVIGMGWCNGDTTITLCELDESGCAAHQTGSCPEGTQCEAEDGAPAACETLGG
jgi:hypothetical protein